MGQDVPGPAFETVETVDGRALRLFADGRYEWVAPDVPVADAPVPARTAPLADLIAPAPERIGAPAEVAAVLRILGGRALLVSPDLPGRALAVALDGVEGAARARALRECGLEGCAVTASGTLRRAARGVYLDAVALAFE